MRRKQLVTDILTRRHTYRGTNCGVSKVANNRDLLTGYFKGVQLEAFEAKKAKVEMFKSVYELELTIEELEMRETEENAVWIKKQVAYYNEGIDKLLVTFELYKEYRAWLISLRTMQKSHWATVC